MNNLKKLGYALSNLGLQEDIKAEVVAQNPGFTDKEVDDMVKEVQVAATLFNKYNKKAYKPTGITPSGDKLDAIKQWIKETE